MTKPDYSKENYCVECGLLYPKDVIKCNICKRKLRFTPRNKKVMNSEYKPVSQKQAIKNSLEYYLDRGMTDKMKIFTKVVDDLKVPRPTVRRVARELRIDFLHKIQILQNDWTKIGRQLNGKI